MKWSNLNKQSGKLLNKEQKSFTQQQQQKSTYSCLLLFLFDELTFLPPKRTILAFLEKI